jgi:hypothetical protein
MIRTRVLASWTLICFVCALSSLVVEKSASCASFSAKSSVTLNFPAEVAGTFSYSVPATGFQNTTKIEVGNAQVTKTDPTRTFVGGVLTLTAGPVSGNAGPPSGFAGSVGAINVGGHVDFPLMTLTNTSNELFTASFTGQFSYELTTDGGAPPPEYSYAAALLQISGGNPITNFLQPPATYFPTKENGADETNSVAIAFNVPIQANSTINLAIELQAAGVAQYAPEPSGLLLLGLGFFPACFARPNRRLPYIDATDSASAVVAKRPSAPTGSS